MKCKHCGNEIESPGIECRLLKKREYCGVKFRKNEIIVVNSISNGIAIWQHGFGDTENLIEGIDFCIV